MGDGDGEKGEDGEDGEVGVGGIEEGGCDGS